MAAAETLPQVQQPIDPVRSAAPAPSTTPASSDTPASKPRKEHRWVILLRWWTTHRGVILHRWGITPRWRITPRLLLPLIIVVVANLAIITMIIISWSGDSGSAATGPAQQPPIAPGAAPGNLPATIGEGMFVVGKDIAPGTYQTTGPSGAMDCYWERLKYTGDPTDSIVANDLGPGPAMVRIDSSDAAFQTRWCHTWTKVR